MGKSENLYSPFFEPQEFEKRGLRFWKAREVDANDQSTCIGGSDFEFSTRVVNKTTILNSVLECFLATLRFGLLKLSFGKLTLVIKQTYCSLKSTFLIYGLAKHSNSDPPVHVDWYFPSSSPALSETKSVFFELYGSQKGGVYIFNFFHEDLDHYFQKYWQMKGISTADPAYHAACQKTDL
mgnify:CR=1 FL=1